MAVDTTRTRVMRARRKVAKSVTFPAPVGGWNSRDGLPSMPVDDAVLLENWFPSSTSVDVRKGFTPWVSSVEGYVESLFAYSGGATNKLFAATSAGTIYDISTQDSYLTDERGRLMTTEDGRILVIEFDGSRVSVTDLSNGRFQYVNIATAGGNYLIVCNGADSVRSFNGTDWGTPSITGVTSSTLIHVNLHKNRLWFIQKDTLSAWYLPVQSIAGAAAELDLKSFASKGGYLMAMATWTIDAGYGVDDLAAFITSNGQVIVYRGTDPASSATWALVGIWDIGQPIGRRCFIKWGGDVLLILQDGVQTMSGALQSSRTIQRISLTDKIQPSVGEAVTSSGSNFGWQLIFYPNGDQVILNVPIAERVNQEQYVMNATTKAWCRFTAIHAGCWENYNNLLYFGDFEFIGKAWDGTSDAGTEIETAAVQAFSELKRPGVQKRVTLFQTLFYTNGQPEVTGGINVDYDTTENTASLQTQGSLYGVWDEGTWDSAKWAPDLDVRRSWNGAAGVGNAFAPTLNTSTADMTLQWVNSTIVFEEGGYV